MAKYQDRKSIGKSSIVPFVRGEHPKQRHDRRFNAALELQNHVKDWCEKNNVILKINNEGHHWIFTKTNFIAEWWPSSAKLIFNKQWKNGIHCHDYSQVLALIEQKIK